MLSTKYLLNLQKSAEVPHPLDTNYGLLNCGLDLVDQKSKEFKVNWLYHRMTHVGV